jgi:hypothetical protein
MVCQPPKVFTASSNPTLEIHRESTAEICFSPKRTFATKPRFGFVVHRMM